eukprot:TRINITY_DN25722_c0_g1_i1.p1 TRINITY_DN25722_c0_g1~~TRINITY_DN25722_c0_g1_i1.p1  ORF type:complete len:588 (+),score=104.38 TRINITY_DN25722_c0_g1_i1:59-1765(+)
MGDPMLAGDQPPLDAAVYADDGSGSRTGSLVLESVGTALVIAASFISCFGTNLQKLSLTRGERGCRVIWWSGMLLMVLGSVLDVAALPFVPMSRVAALGATGMVANLVITPPFLNEKRTRHDVVGGAVIVCGTVIACVFGAGEQHAATTEELLNYFSASPFVGYGVAVLVSLVGLLWVIRGYELRSHASVDAGLRGQPTVKQLMNTHWAHEHADELRALTVPCGREFPFFAVGPQVYPVVFASFAGICGAQNIMFAKASLTFFRNAVTGSETGENLGLLFVFIIPTVVCVLLQVMYLNKALAIYYDALFVLPVYQANWILGGVLSGIVFYQEYRVIPGNHSALFVLGLGIVLCGIGILSQRRSKAHVPTEALPMRDDSTIIAPSTEDGIERICSPQLVRTSSTQQHPRASGDWTSFVRPFAPVTELRDDVSASPSLAGSFCPSGIQTWETESQHTLRGSCRILPPSVTGREAGYSAVRSQRGRGPGAPSLGRRGSGNIRSAPQSSHTPPPVIGSDGRATPATPATPGQKTLLTNAALKTEVPPLLGTAALAADDAGSLSTPTPPQTPQ